MVRLLTKVLHIDKNSFVEYRSGSSVFNKLLYKIFSSEKKHIAKHKCFPWGLSIVALAKRKDHGSILQNDKDNENVYWDRIAEKYAEEALLIQPTFYKNSAALLNKELLDDFVVADIGNGGIINYAYKNLKKLSCIDLSPSKSAAEKYKNEKNIEFVEGNILHLDNIADSTYDAVILQCVLHHLAGENLKKTNDNVKTALAECMRILKPEGKLLIVESTVVLWFEKVERALYPVMQAFFRIVHFDTVYQYSANSLLNLVKNSELGKIISTQRVEIGKSIWLLRKKIPTCLTPCQVEWIVIQKEKNGLSKLEKGK